MLHACKIRKWCLFLPIRLIELPVHSLGFSRLPFRTTYLWTMSDCHNRHAWPFDLRDISQSISNSHHRWPKKPLSLEVCVCVVVCVHTSYLDGCSMCAYMYAYTYMRCLRSCVLDAHVMCIRALIHIHTFTTHTHITHESVCVCACMCVRTYMFPQKTACVRACIHIFPCVPPCEYLADCGCTHLTRHSSHVNTLVWEIKRPNQLLKMESSLKIRHIGVHTVFLRVHVDGEQQYRINQVSLHRVAMFLSRNAWMIYAPVICVLIQAGNLLADRDRKISAWTPWKTL